MIAAGHWGFRGDSGAGDVGDLREDRQLGATEADGRFILVAVHVPSLQRDVVADAVPHCVCLIHGVGGDCGGSCEWDAGRVADAEGEAPVVRGLGNLGSNRGGEGEQAGRPAVGFGAVAGILEPAGEAGHREPGRPIRSTQ